jgi:hypothetical protein
MTQTQAQGKLGRVEIIVCPNCGEGYLHTGQVTPVALKFQATHGTNQCKLPKDEAFDREEALAIFSYLANETPATEH